MITLPYSQQFERQIRSMLKEFERASLWDMTITKVLFIQYVIKNNTGNAHDDLL